MILQLQQRKPAREIPDSILFAISINETLADLKERGYQLKFRREATCLYCTELNDWIMPDAFVVDDYYHFEDISNPDGDRTIYAITTTQGQKGFLVDACLVYEDNISPEMKEKLQLEYFTIGGIINSIKN
jgi:hypothetical protein